MSRWPNPTLAEMTEAAIDVLSNDPEGFFLLVEHEGTDDHQHAGRTRLAIESALEFADAVEAAVARTDPEETLIVVTSDHGQALAMAGNSHRGAPILGLSTALVDGAPSEELELAEDGLPFPVLGYYAGPRDWEGTRPDPRDRDTAAQDYVPPSAIPTEGVPHSGADVGVYANGPWAHLFTGVSEQNALFDYIRHAMEPNGEED